MATHRKDSRFKPAGDLTIRAARTLKVDLLDHMSSASTIVVDLPDQFLVDLSFVQTIESARVFADREGKSLSLARPAGGPLHDVLQRGGLIEGMSAQDRQFWLHQGETQ